MAYLRKFTLAPNTPIVLVNNDLDTIKGLDSLDFTGYTSGSTDATTTSGTADKNGFIWSLPNGQDFPPTGIILFSNNARTYYYEDSDLKTRFEVLGKGLKASSRLVDSQVGVFTGQYKFSDTNPFGKGYALKSLQVKTKFPFDRAGNIVETEYVLWVDTFVKYYTDNVESITPNDDGTVTHHFLDGTTQIFTQDGKPVGNGTGYTTGDGKAKQNRNALLIIGAILLFIATRKRKRK